MERSESKEFAFTKLIKCGLCGSGITADEKFKTLKSGEARRYVYAAARGRVHRIAKGGAGLYVTINHENRFFTYYGHLDDYDGDNDGNFDYVYVEEGQEVSSGDPIARMGKSGADATHLHFHLLYDENGDGQTTFYREGVDPFGWLPTITGIIHTDDPSDPWIGRGGFRSYYFWHETSPLYNNQTSSLGVSAHAP